MANEKYQSNLQLTSELHISGGGGGGGGACGVYNPEKTQQDSF